MKRLIAIALAGLLAGCAASQQTQTLATACDSYATALDNLTPLRAAGKLSVATVAAVNNVNVLTDPICKNSKPPSNVSAAISAVGAAAVQLEAVKGSIAP